MTRKKIHYDRFAVGFILVYFLFEMVYVSVISQGAGLDDAELASNVSFWSWGYGGSQPPLYTWIAYGLTQIFGLHLWLFQTIKFGLLGSTFLAVYAGLRLLNVRSVVAGAGMLAIFLLPQIGWESQRALTHSIMGTAGSAWTFAAFCLFIKKPSALKACLLGLACAAAILGKYNGTLFIIALFGGALLTEEIRPRLATRYTPMAIISALIVMSPALVFMYMNPAGVAARAKKFAVDKSGHFLLDRLWGLNELVLASLSFVSIALILVLILARLQAVSDAKAPQTVTRSESDNLAEHFLSRVLLFGLGLVCLLIIISGVTNVKDRWLQPLLFLAPAYFAIMLAKYGKTLKYVREYGIISMCLALVVPCVLYISIATATDKLSLPEQLFDYPYLEKALHDKGPFVMVMSRHPQIPGNLRLLDPSLKTVHVGTPFVSKLLQRPLMIVWTSKETLPENIRELLPEDIRKVLQDAGYPTDGQRGEIAVGYRGSTKVKRTVYYLYLP